MTRRWGELADDYTPVPNHWVVIITDGKCPLPVVMVDEDGVLKYTIWNMPILK